MFIAFSLAVNSFKVATYNLTEKDTYFFSDI